MQHNYGYSPSAAGQSLLNRVVRQRNALRAAIPKPDFTDEAAVDRYIDAKRNLNKLDFREDHEANMALPEEQR